MINLFKRSSANKNTDKYKYDLDNIRGDVFDAKINRPKQAKVFNHAKYKYTLTDISSADISPSHASLTSFSSSKKSPDLIQDIISVKKPLAEHIASKTDQDKTNAKVDKLSSNFKELFNSDEANINQIRKYIPKTHPLTLLAYILLGAVPSMAIIAITFYSRANINIIFVIMLLMLNYIIYLFLPKNYVFVWGASIANSFLISLYLIWWLNAHLSHYKLVQALSIIVLLLLNIFLYIRNYNIGLIMSSVFMSILLATLTSMGIINLNLILPFLILHIIIISLLQQRYAPAPIFLNIHKVALLILLIVLVVIIRPTTVTTILSLALLLLYSIYLYFISHKIVTKTIYLLIGNILLLCLALILNSIFNLKYIYILNLALALSSLSMHYIKYLYQDDFDDLVFLRWLILVIIALMNLTPFIFRGGQYAILMAAIIIVIHAIFYIVFHNTINWINLALMLIIAPTLANINSLLSLKPSIYLVIYYCCFSLILLALTLYMNMKNFKALNTINILFMNITILAALILGYYSGPLAMIIGAFSMALVLGVIGIKFSWPNLMLTVIIAINLALAALNIYYNWQGIYIWLILGVNISLYLGSLILPQRFAIPTAMAITIFAPLMILLNIPSSQGHGYYIAFWALAILILLTLFINKFNLYYNLVLIIIYAGLGAYLYSPNNLMIVLMALALLICTFFFRKNRVNTIFDFRKKIN